MFLSLSTRRTPRLLATALGGAVIATAIAVPAATGSQGTIPTPPGTVGRVGDHGSAPAPGWASVTVQLTANQPSTIAALAGDRKRTGRARRAALLAAAPSTTTSDTAARFLTGAGLTITNRTPFSITASGPRARIAALFPLAKATRAARRAAADSSPLVVPPGLAAVASFAVGGVDTHRVAYPRYVRAVSAAKPSFTLAPITGASARALYNVPAAATTAPGQGITVATLQFSGWDSGNLTTFAAHNKLPDPVRSGQYQGVSVDGANPKTPDGSDGDVEVALDQEALLTAAPHANQVAYFAPNTTQGFVDAFNAVAGDALAERAGHLFTALSVSWGGCEPYWDPGDMRAIDAAIGNVVAAGVTVFASSGDAGAYDCSTVTAPNNTLTVDFPASDPFVIGVGGLSTDPVARQERTWWTPQGPAPGYLGSGGGGGVSAVWPAPPWQSGLVSGTTARLVPDISLDADPSSGLSIWAQGVSMPLVGGTSLAAPLAAATLTDLQIARGASSSYGLGNIAGSLYAAPASSFRDTTAGTNGYYPAKAGYDLATGLGAPQWSALAASIWPGQAQTSGYHASDPLCRLFDTRAGSGTCAGAAAVPRAPLGADRALRVKVRGVGGVPDNATAVVLNLTAADATTPTFVTAWPTGTARPAVSTLNTTKGGTSPNLATVTIGADGSVSLFNSLGRVSLVADLVGWFAPGPGDGYTATTPCRVLDTRAGSSSCPGAAAVARAPLDAGGSLRVRVHGVAGIPDTATAVAVNLTAVDATARTWLTAWADGTPQPGISNLNPAPGQGPSPNLAIVPIGSNGYIDIYNAAGSVHLVVDVAGWFEPGVGSSYTTVRPCRVLDTRSGQSTCPGAGPLSRARLGPRQTLRIKVSTGAGIPVGANARAVVLNLTGVGATTSTWLTAWAEGTPRPGVSNLNPAPGQGPSPNLAIVPIGSSGYIDVYNAAGQVDLVVDVAGYFGPG